VILIARVTMPGPTLTIVRDGQQVGSTPLPQVAGNGARLLAGRVNAGLLILGYRVVATHRVLGGFEYTVERVA
jgi:hypothetical protein